MHLVGNNSSMQPTQLWSVGKSTFFMMCIYKHCFPPMLLVFAMKCCTKMHCPLPHNHYCCYFLHLYACLTCSSVHASSLHPLLAQHHLCYADVYCVFFYFWYMLHFFVTPLWIVCVHIFVWLYVFWFLYYIFSSRSVDYVIHVRRVAILAFFKPKTTNLAFFESVWVANFLLAFCHFFGFFII